MKRILSVSFSCFLVRICLSQTLYAPNAAIGGSGNANVGIGQSNPTGKLHVYNTNGLNVKFETSSNNAVRLYLTGTDQNWSLRKLTSSDFVIADDTDGGATPFRISPGAGNNALRISSNGSIGMGINPSARLHLYRSGSVDLNLETNLDNAVRIYFTGSNQQWSLRKFTNNRIGFADDTNSGRIPFSIEPGANSNSIYINSDGKVGMGTTDFTGNHKLRVEGSIGAREVKVEASGWSDFVFKDGYKLRPLEEVEQHINQKGHLPEIPTEAEVAENGVYIGEMNAKLLQKIEELTLYLIEQNKDIKALHELTAKQQSEIERLKSK